MASKYNQSNEGSGGRVKHLDTVDFDSTFAAYANHIKQFESIVNGVNKTTNTMVSRWEGQGKKAFEKDCQQVQLNLKDITDIMYDLRDALNDAHAEYIKTDSALSKSFDS